MKSWTELEPDRYRLMNRHYTPGRAGHRIKMVVIHHNAGMLSIDQIWQVWQDREASAHYQVTATGEIGQLVNDTDTAWHAANLLRNQESIGIEHANIGGASADWPISEQTREEGAHLVAALCRYYSLGRPKWGTNVRPHSETGQTSCPYHLGPAGKYGDAYIKRAQYWYDRMTATPTTPTDKDPDMTNSEIAELKKQIADLTKIVTDVQNTVRDAWVQITGGPKYTGFPQSGNRTLMDTVAAIGEKVGVPGTRDIKTGARP